ncbi:MAG: DUF2165 domain-containing protein [Spirosomataceae bacterium]
MDRLLKIGLSFSASVYMFFVVFNNLFDYDSNYQFINHIASMSEIFDRRANAWRAIQLPVFHHLMYVFIILWETLILLLLAVGTLQMIKNINADSITFEKAKVKSKSGFICGVILWFVAFVSIGGEWFLMWQSQKWNGQQNAFFLTICFLLFANYLNNREIV